MTGFNRLASEKSPYLLQHQYNPVWWYPWGDEAFAAAREQQKPIFLSIGYSTCYWCHVMERDSFEHDDVAAVLNRDFISIKVDREERPDLDQIYMDATVGLTGHGGWPMSVFLTPEREPFYAGTFFWRAQFLQLLEAVTRAWRERREEIVRSAASIREAIDRTPLAGTGELSDLPLRYAVREFEERFDPQDGGFGSAPKFPPTQQLGLLLRLHRRSGAPQLLTMVTTTLDRMARGGIFDQLEGGFSRYSVDASWTVPHFEKMLYDNALLTRCYLEAFEVTANPMWADVARRTLDYLKRRMCSPEGAFYSAEDAGEVDREGEFYLWRDELLRAALNPAQYDALASVFVLDPNFEHQQIVLTMRREVAWQERERPEVRAALEALAAIRETRTRPHLDDKVLTSWNALTIAAFAHAGMTLQEQHYIDQAVRTASFLEQHLWRAPTLLRRYREGQAGIPGFLDDYAYLIQALLVLYQATFDRRWLRLAREVQAAQDHLLWDRTGGGYHYSAAPDAIIKKKDLIDGATPAGNGVALANLQQLAAIFGDSELEARSAQLQELYQPLLDRAAAAFSSALHAVDHELVGAREVVVTGGTEAERLTAVERLRRGFNPHLFMALAQGGEEQVPLLAGRAREEFTLYLCTNGTCEAPSDDIDAIAHAANQLPPLELGNVTVASPA